MPVRLHECSPPSSLTTRYRSIRVCASACSVVVAVLLEDVHSEVPSHPPDPSGSQAYVASASTSPSSYKSRVWTAGSPFAS